MQVEAPAKCCFQFEGDGQSCVAVLQVRYAVWHTY